MDWEAYCQQRRRDEAAHRARREREAAEAVRIAEEAIAESRGSGETAIREWTSDLSDALLFRSTSWDATALHTSWYSGHDEDSPRTGRWKVQLLPELPEGHLASSEIPLVGSVGANQKLPSA